MGLKKKTIRAVNKLLHDPKRRKLYTEEELIYMQKQVTLLEIERCLLYTSPSPRDYAASRMPSSA